MEEPRTTMTPEAVKEEVKEKAGSAWNTFSSFFKPQEHPKTTRVVTKVETVSTDELYKGRSLFEVLGETGKLWSFYISEKFTAAKETADTMKHSFEDMKHSFEEKKHALDQSPTWNYAVQMIKNFGTGVKDRTCHAYDVLTHSKALDRLKHSKGYNALVHNKTVQDVSAKSKALCNSVGKSWEKINETFWEFWEPVEEEAKKVAPREEMGHPTTSTTSTTPSTTTTTTPITPIELTPTPTPTVSLTPTPTPIITSSFSSTTAPPLKETEMKSVEKPSGTTTSTSTTGTTGAPLGVQRPNQSSAREQNV